MHNSRLFYAGNGIVVARASLTGPRPVIGVLAACFRTLLGVRRKLALRSAAGQLADMSDYELKDIGITRSDIPRAVQHGRTSF
jgi:uncharacterized protein YjiS (DUF1127 family)